MKILDIQPDNSDPRFKWKVELLNCGKEITFLVRDRKHLLDRMFQFDKFPSSDANMDYVFDIENNFQNTL